MTKHKNISFEQHLSYPDFQQLVNNLLELYTLDPQISYNHPWDWEIKLLGAVHNPKLFFRLSSDVDHGDALLSFPCEEYLDSITVKCFQDVVKEIDLYIDVEIKQFEGMRAQGVNHD